MADFSAGHIGQVEANQLTAHLNERFGDPAVRFYPGVSYRNLMTLGNVDNIDVRCTQPHDIPDQPVAKHQPRGAGADRVLAIQAFAARLLQNHEINQVRRDLGENPANAIWLWGQGKPCAFESFQQRFGVRGAVIAAVDLIRGIAVSLGFDLIEVPGATGYLDTNYCGKGEAALRALEDHDLVVVHIEAPDEAGHNGDAAGKVAALEQIDQWIVGPLLNHLHESHEWRMLIAPDHPTPVSKRIHTDAAPPFCMAGTGIAGRMPLPFSETNAASAELQIERGHELMEFFLRA
jgi:2,3-bisphosphoglycerate-independent phosphoglycerate mutase